MGILKQRRKEYDITLSDLAVKTKIEEAVKLIT